MMHTARLSWRGHRFAQTPAFISSYRNTNPKGLKVCFLLLKLCDKIKIITGALMGSLCPVITSQTFFMWELFSFYSITLANHFTFQFSATSNDAHACDRVTGVLLC